MDPHFGAPLGTLFLDHVYYHLGDIFCQERGEQVYFEWGIDFVKGEIFSFFSV